MILILQLVTFTTFFIIKVGNGLLYYGYEVNLKKKCALYQTEKYSVQYYNSVELSVWIYPGFFLRKRGV